MPRGTYNLHKADAAKPQPVRTFMHGTERDVWMKPLDTRHQIR